MPINITEEFVRNLMEQNAALITQVANLSATVDSLQQTIKELQEQLNKNSKNSSKPPLMLSRLVDTFFSRTSWTMLLYAENHSISVA